MERTGFWLEGPRIVLDAGVDTPWGSKQPNLILVTHGHIDHMNALPMLVRHRDKSDAKDNDTVTRILAPYQITHSLREFVQLSFSVKVDDGFEVPQEYAPPDPGMRAKYADKCEEEIPDGPFRAWRPVRHGQRLRFGKDKKWTALQPGKQDGLSSTPCTISLKKYHI